MPLTLCLLQRQRNRLLPETVQKVSLTSEGWRRKGEGGEASEVGKLLLNLQATQPLPSSSLLWSLGMKCLLFEGQEDPKTVLMTIGTRERPEAGGLLS